MFKRKKIYTEAIQDASLMATDEIVHFPDGIGAIDFSQTYVAVKESKLVENMVEQFELGLEELAQSIKLNDEIIAIALERRNQLNLTKASLTDALERLNNGLYSETVEGTVTIKAEAK